MKPHATFRMIVAAVLFSPGLAAAEQQGTPITFTMPQPGRVTIAINDPSGIRVRNLIADAEKPKGSHTVYWDGLDDDGRVLPPGTYGWIGLTRGDLHAVYRGAFTHGNPPWIHGTTGGWAADHGSPVAAACIGERIFLGTGISEGGHGLICCDLDGNKLWGQRWLNRTVWSGANSLAADGERLFATSRPWQEQRIWEVDPQTGKSWWIFTFPKEGLPQPIGKIGGIYLAGARKTGPTRWDGELYASDVCGDGPRTFVFSTARNPETNDPMGYDDTHGMKLLRVLPVRIWGMTWLTDGRCVAALDKSIAFIDTQTGNTTPVTDAVEAPVAIASDSRNRLYVSDWGGQIWGTFPKSSFKIIGLRNSDKASIQVKIFDTSGRLLRAMGRPGGQPIGAFDPNDFFMPQQLAIDPRGRLWVTEFRLTPKRVSVWEIPDDPAKDAPKLVRELFGPPAYGEGAFMEDAKNPQRITDGEYGVTWEVDLAAGKYAPLNAAWRDFSICWENPENRPGLPFGGMPKKTFAYEGRTYQMLRSGVIGEKRNGRFMPLAAFGTVHDLIFYRWSIQEQWLPKQILDAAKKHPQWAALAKKNGLDPAMEDFPHIKEYSVDSRPTWPIELMAFNWTDSPGEDGTAGDGEWQADEIKLSPRQPAPGGQLCFGSNLDLLAEVGGCLWRIKREGFNKAGAPVYDWAQAEQISKGRIGQASHVAPDGSMLTADTNVVRLIGPNGTQLWSYPTPLSNGHGWRDMANAREKLLSPGAIYGGYGIQGVAETPVGPVFMLHGGHGMNYFLTRDDGLFIGTIFKPCITAENWSDAIPEAKSGVLLDDVTLGDECFGGSFARAEAARGGFEKGHHYMLGLGRSAVVELTGLDSIKRLKPGKIALGRKDADAARARVLADAAAKWREQEALATLDVLPAPANAERWWENRAGYGLNELSMLLMHNEKGLGVRFSQYYWVGYHPSQIFVNDAPSWERVAEFGDAAELLIAADPRAASGPSVQRIVFARMVDAPVAVRYHWMKSAEAPAGAKAIARRGDETLVAEKLDIPLQAKTQIAPTLWGDEEGVVLAQIPWSTLGIVYKPDLVLKGNFGAVFKQPGGGRPLHKTWVGSIGAGAFDPASALEMHPELWAPIALRPEGYQSAPDVLRMKPAAKDRDLPVLESQASHPADPARYAEAVTWVTRTHEALLLKWYVAKDTSPFTNNGKDWTSLFKTGDACDLQIASPALGSCRYLITMFEDKPAVVRFRYDAKDASADQGVTYKSPVSQVLVPVVERLPIEPRVERGADWYTVQVAIPWNVLGIVPKGGTKIPAELGVLRSDPTGTQTARRDYWHSGLSGMVNDVPTEVKPTANWGALSIE